MSERIKLDLGSGPRPAEGFRGVNREPGLTDFQVDFDSGEPWPFEDDSIEELRSSHCIEHLSQVDALESIIVEGFPAPRSSKGVATDGTNRGVAAGTTLRSPDSQHMAAGGHLWRRTARRKNTVFHFFDEAFRVAKKGAKFEVRWPSHQNSMSYGDPTHQRFLSGALYLYLNRATRQERGVEFYNVKCNWVGTVCETTSRKPSTRRGFDEQVGQANEIRYAMKHEWNVSEETVMTLTADK